MPRDPFWAHLHKQSIEQMLRLADEAEDFVYDEIVGANFLMDDPEERLTFYNTLDMQALQQNNPKLWERYSKDALTLQQRDNQQKLSALDELRSEQEKQWSQFSRQVKPQQALGLGPIEQMQTGLNAPEIPMGGFSG